MEKVTAILTKEKETPKKIRFAEPGDSQQTIGTIYLPKWLVKGVEKIRVTVEAA